MNRYWMICRLRWPAMLLLTGVIALLDQWDILSWNQAWPLYLILWGVLALAERMMLAQEPPPVYPYPGMPMAGQPWPGTPGSGYGTGQATGYAPVAGAATTEIVPARADFRAPQTTGTTHDDGEVL